MTLPEGVQPSGPVDPTPTSASSDPTVDPAPVAEEETPEEAASDAALRQWAKDNGIEGVPTSGRLSAAWRDEITAAMADAQAQSPKVEASVSVTSSEPSTSDTAETAPPTGGPEVTEEEAAPAPIPLEREQMEYRSVFRPPNTWISSQTYTN